jgi:hypothetical protein
MQISVVDSVTGRVTVLAAAASDTVAEVKAKIQAKEDIPVDLQRLKFDGLEMMDCDTLDDYGVKPETALQLIRRYNIHVDALSGGNIPLIVDGDCTVRSLKHAIHRRRGIPPEYQRLTYDHNLLEDNCTLSHYSIEAECRLSLVAIDAPLQLEVIDMHSGRDFRLVAKPSNTIGEIKAMMELLVGIPADQQQLFMSLELRGTVQFLEELEDAECVGYRELSLRLSQKD